MFKVLVISYYFPPLGLSGVQRVLKFVKYMPKYGWSPTVLTSDTPAYYAYDYDLLDEINDENIKVVRVSGNEINSKLKSKGTIIIPPEWMRKIFSFVSSLFFIPDNKTGWCKKALPVARELLKKENFDMIFVSGPPFSTAMMAVKLKDEFRIPLIIDYRDLWFGYQFAIYPTPFHSIKIKSMEYKALKKADKVTVTNRSIKEKLVNVFKFVTLNEVVIIPHGYDPEDFERVTLIPRKDKKMVITYAGLFYEFITPKYFFQAFNLLRDERPDIANNIELHFIGIMRRETKNLIKKLGLYNYVKEFGYLSHLETVKQIISSDILWLMVGRGRNCDTISSGKLFEYFGARKPIIACLPEGALKQSVRDYGASYISEPDDIVQIKNNMIKAYVDFRNGSLPMPEPEQVEKHRRDYLTEQLIKEFQFLMRGRI